MPLLTVAGGCPRLRIADGYPRKNMTLRKIFHFFRDAVFHPREYFSVYSMPTKIRTHFFINIVIGVLISFLLHTIEHTDFGENAVNMVSDALIRLESPPVQDRFSNKWVNKVYDDLICLETWIGIPRDSGRVVYIDIDKETYLRWQSPLFAPRDRLAEYITWAARYGAGVIVLDILTDYPDCCIPGRDAKLRSALASISKTGSSTKLILPVAIDSEGGVRGSIFDDLVDEKTIFRGIPYGSAMENDRVIRYWSTYRTAKESGRIKVLWGVPILAATVSDNRYYVLKDLEGTILEMRPPIADASSSVAHDRMRSLPFSDGKKICISLDKEDIYSQRIRFLMLPGRNSLQSVRSADYLKEPSAEEDRRTFGDFFRGKIVVIGSS